MTEEAVTFEQVRKLFKPMSNYEGKFQCYYGWIDSFELGSLNGFPACKVVADDVHADADTETIFTKICEGIQQQPTKLLYEIDEDSNMTRMYILANDNAALCQAVSLFPHLVATYVCDKLAA